MGYVVKVYNGIVPDVKKLHPGQPKGKGKIQKILAHIVPGNPQSCAWGIPRSLMFKLQSCAHRSGMKVRIRMLPDGSYAFWRLT